MAEGSVKVRWLIDEEPDRVARQEAEQSPRMPRTPHEWLRRCRELAASDEDAAAIAKECRREGREGRLALAEPVHQACLFYKQDCWCRSCDPDGSTWRQRQIMDDLQTSGLESVSVRIPEVLAEWLPRCRAFAWNEEDAVDIARLCCEEERRGFLGYATPMHQSALFYGAKCRCSLCAPTARMSWREKLRYHLLQSPLGRLFSDAEGTS